MKIRVTIEIDLETGQYSLEYGNLSNSGKKIDAKELINALEKVVAGWKLKFVN